MSTVAKQIGIDLGTSNTMIYLKDKGIVLRAPSVVALDRTTKEVIASGTTAKRMVGKTPGNILALRPLKDGVITSDKKGEWCLGDWCGPNILYPDRDITSHNQQVFLPAPMVNTYFMVKSTEQTCTNSFIIY